MLRAASLMLIISMLGGCAAPGPVPGDTFYRLPPVMNADTTEPLTDGVIHVAELHVEGIQSERAILYSPATNSVILDQYHYHFWSTGPGRLVRDHLADYLVQVQAADKVVVDSAFATDLSIRGRVQQLLHVREDDNSSVLVTLQLRLDRSGQRQPLLMNTYSEQMSVPGESMELVVQAMAKALTRIYEQFLHDARQSLSG